MEKKLSEPGGPASRRCLSSAAVLDVVVYRRGEEEEG